jgi:hypothetical protein
VSRQPFQARLSNRRTTAPWSISARVTTADLPNYWPLTGWSPWLAGSRWASYGSASGLELSVSPVGAGSAVLADQGQVQKASSWLG